MKASKTLALVFILALACLALAACGGAGSDEGGEAASGNPIVGTWASEDFGGAFIFTFNEDSTGNYDASGTDMPFTYTAEDGALSILYDGDDLPFESEYTVDGDKFIMKDSLGDDVVYNRQ